MNILFSIMAKFQTASLLTSIFLGLTVTSAFATNRYVDLSATGTADGLSWVNAETKLQDALLAATAGDTIHIATGTYYPDETSATNTDSRASNFKLKSGVALLGGYPSSGGTLAQRDPSRHITILSGDIDQNDHSGGDNSLNPYQVSIGASVFTYPTTNIIHTYSHCLVENYSKATLDSTGTSPDTNFEPVNPLFSREVNPASSPSTGGDLRLLSGSPALNVGNNNINSEATDLAGSPRKIGIIDLGTYEGSYVTFTHLGFTNPDADDNQNGISNLLDYATGGDPTAPNNPNLRATIDANGYNFRYRNNAADLSFKFQKSATLLPESWQDMTEGIDYTMTSSSDNGDQTALTLTLLSTDPKHFIRSSFTTP